MKLIDECKKLEQKMIETRRRLHRCPEIGDELPLTREAVCAYLDEAGIPYRKNSLDDGVIVDICGKEGGKTLAFRADMDALHVEEETPVPFRSQIPGQMHACGHDAHTAVLLAVAEMLHSCRDRFRGTARLLFQTGEETATGALNMLREGALEGVDAILCMHVASMDEKGFRTGNIAAVPGPVSSFKDKFIIRVKGKGAHGAYPHKGIDPIAVAARIHIAFDELCAREIRTDIPAVLTVGSFVAGEDHNTIPETAEMKGSIRTQDEAVSEFLLRRMREICEYTAKAFGAEAEFVHIKGSRAVFNDPALCQVLWRAVKKEWGEDRLLTAYSAPRMGSDDFANYASKVPGVYFHLQTANPEKGIFGGGHTPRFHLDEDALLGGLVTYVATALEYLA